MNRFGGIDWGGKINALCVVDVDGSTASEDAYPHSESGIEKLIARMRALDVCRIGIERPGGLLVDRIVEEDLAVMPVPVTAVKATRPRFESAGRKSDSFDAYCLAQLARTDSHRYPRLQPDSDETKALRRLTRTREEVVRWRLKLASQLGAQLEEFWPGARRIFTAVDSKTSLAFLRRFPSPADAEGLDEVVLEEFLKEVGYRKHRPTADLLVRLHEAPRGRAGPIEASACRAAVLGLVSTLEPVVAQLGTVNSWISEATQAHPDGKIFLPLFKEPSRAITPAVLIAEIGDDRARYPHAEALAARAGVVPVTQESGTKSRAMFRYACNKRLRGAVANLANATRTHHPWAQKVYTDARGRGIRHPHALRILGRAWIRVLWRCWHDGVPYDPAKHGNLRRLQSSP